MDVSIGDHWEGFVQAAVESGRYATASDVIREGLRLVEEREAKLAGLRQMIEASISEGGGVTDDELGRTLEATLAELVQEGH